MADLFVSVAPIAILIYWMVRKHGMPAHKALPLAALLFYIIQLTWFSEDPNKTHATVLFGFLTALTPIMIVWGAIFMFRALEYSGAMDTIRKWLKQVSGNRVAQLMIVAWAFQFLVEGASGFGTPAALAAPILVGLGFPAIQVAVVCLIMNTVPVSFGAVGTPTWFGFGELGLSHQDMVSIGFRSALMHTSAGLIIPLMALRFLVSWHEIRANLPFIYLSILSGTVPYTALASFNYEFPAIVGGTSTLGVTVALALKNVGMAKAEVDERPMAEDETVSTPAFLRAASPLLFTVLFLVASRIGELGLKGLLQNDATIWERSIGSIGHFQLGAGLTLELQSIFGESAVNWSLAPLYVPSILPFGLAATIIMGTFPMSREQIRRTLTEPIQQVRRPAIALFGALIFVKLLMMGGEGAPALIIGKHMANSAGAMWQYAAPYLGALGSFFSGSNTISNLTFGPIQQQIAEQIASKPVNILAMQSVGGAMGNMVCIHNIVAVCSVLGIDGKEGYILKRTFLPMVAYGLIAGLVGGLVL